MTTVGLMLRVAAVIVVVGIADGLRTYTEEWFSGLATQITITPTVPLGAAALPLRESDAHALGLSSAVPDAAGAIPVVAGAQVARVETRFVNTTVNATTADYLDIADRAVMTGQFFTVRQARENARVAVLGPNVAAALFLGDNSAAIGKTIWIERTPFEVVRVLAADGQEDDATMVPLSSGRARLLGGADRVDKMLVRAASIAQVYPAAEQIRQMMSARHNVRQADRADFSIRTKANVIDKADGYIASIAMNGLATAGWALLVGAIGVGNVMLVSVASRTPEIGIRRAVGARRREILTLVSVTRPDFRGLDSSGPRVRWESSDVALLRSGQP
jgi:putative ABC transport system permease protein